METNNNVILQVTEFCKSLIDHTEEDIKAVEGYASKEFIAKERGKIEAWKSVLNLLQGIDSILK